MKKILVVDDSATIRAAIRRILEPMGYTVDEAEDGAAALLYCREWGTADAILLDVDMPVMDGIAFQRALGGEPSLPQPPVVMCTTHASLDRIAAALEAGADEYIMKPFSAEIIGGKLAEVGVG